MNKTALRQQLLKQRQLLSEEYYKSATQLITNKLLKLTEYQSASTILVFHSMPMEFDTSLFIEHSWQLKKKVYLPRCQPHRQLSLHAHCPNVPLIQSAFGIEEPQVDAPMIDPIDLEFILVPSLGATLEGKRLGYGGGYYDRLLQRTNAVTVMPVFEALLQTDLPTDDWDIKIDHVITEKQQS